MSFREMAARLAASPTSLVYRKAKADYDISDKCRKCEELFSAEEIRHYREESSGADDDGMPTYCQSCLDKMHTS